MKPDLTLLLSLIMLTVSSGAYGQAYFNLANSDLGVDAPVFDAEFNRLAGSAFLAELYGSASSASLAPALEFGTSQRVMAHFGTGNNAGYFMGFPVTISDVAPYEYAWLQVRAWDARLGSSYEAVEALGMGGYGESSLFYARGSDPPAINPDIPAPLIGLQSFSLRPIIPEPSTSLLLALGPGLLWWARRPRVRGENSSTGNLMLRRQSCGFMRTARSSSPTACRSG